MQHHVGIGMTGEPLGMGDAHAAERDMVAGPEGMHVEDELRLQPGHDISLDSGS